MVSRCPTQTFEDKLRDETFVFHAQSGRADRSTQRKWESAIKAARRRVKAAEECLEDIRRRQGVLERDGFQTPFDLDRLRLGEAEFEAISERMWRMKDWTHADQILEVVGNLVRVKVRVQPR